MAIRKFGGAASPTSFTEFGAGRSRTEPTGLQQIPQDDVLQYINEMSATLSYMSIAHNFERLSELLAAAAVEAENCIRGDIDGGTVVDEEGAVGERVRPARHEQ